MVYVKKVRPQIDWVCSLVMCRYCGRRKSALVKHSSTSVRTVSMETIVARARQVVTDGMSHRERSLAADRTLDAEKYRVRTSEGRTER